MPYADISDLTSRLSGDLAILVADADNNGVADTAILQAALDDASAEIDQTLGSRYITPIDPAPDRLVRPAVDLAVFFLFQRRREALPAERARAAAEARATLAAIASGAAELHGGSPRLRALNTESTTRKAPRHFDRGALEPY